MPHIEFAPLREEWVADAKRVIITVVCEILANDTRPETIARTLQRYEAMGELRDVDEFQSHYFGRRGIFLVLLSDGRIVGTGALRLLDGSVAELKRMWFLPAYRGRGLGRQMAERLLEFAREHQYTHVRLDTGTNQPAAMKLYRRLGFQEIPRYNQSTCDVFMELEL